MLHFLANFTLPEEPKEGEESVFKEIVFTELQREEATKVVAEYNKVCSIDFSVHRFEFSRQKMYLQFGWKSEVLVFCVKTKQSFQPST